MTLAATRRFEPQGPKSRLSGHRHARGRATTRQCPASRALMRRDLAVLAARLRDRLQRVGSRVGAVGLQGHVAKRQNADHPCTGTH